MGMAHAQRRIAAMWTLALRRFREFINAGAPTRHTPPEDIDGSS
jgi:hypothetical protein